MQSGHVHKFQVLFLALLLVSLASPFLSNPFVFDDIFFFLPGAPEKFLTNGAQLSLPRWWVYETLAGTFVLTGSNLPWLRLGNLLAHFASTLALYVFIRRLLIDLDRKPISGLGAEASAFAAAILFALHPIAIFTQGYLIQRTIVCATLFSLLSWLAFWHSLSTSRSALLGSCLLFAIALLAKEHAAMVPAVSFCLLLLYQRSGFKLAIPVREIACALLLQSLLAILFLIQSKGIIGTTYEFLSTEILENEASNPDKTLYPLSILNQATVFFEYIFLWLLPNPGWISIDIRRAFPADFSSWALWGGVLSYTAYGIASFILLLRGGVVGLMGCALLAPWLLFVTEFSTVRLIESFVLYRSYLWAPPLFIFAALGFRRLSKQMAYALLTIFGISLFALSFDRLTTLSHHFLVWDEAALQLEKSSQKKEVLGAYRIYYNRGITLLQEGILDAALADFDRVLELQPKLGDAHHQRGTVYLQMGEWQKAQESFERAMVLQPNNARTYLGSARALEALGKMREAREALQIACTMGNTNACESLILP